MKIICIRMTGLIAVIATLLSCSGEKLYMVSNTTGEDIVDLTVILGRSEVNRYLPDSTLNLPVVVKTENGTYLPSQCDDIDGDGKWDELAFLCDLEAGESSKVFFEASDTLLEFPIRTNIRFGRMEKPFEEIAGDLRMKTTDTKFTAPVYQMEGPAWENDIIAFRNYYDARNGIDIFGKTTRAMVMDSVGVNGRDYHTPADWGMDILKVGNSLGAGAIAIAIGDSLYRIGPCEEGHYRLVTEGPVRAVLELTYKDIPAGERHYDVVHQISICAGDRFYRSKVWIDKLQGDEELVTGIVNLHNISSDTISVDKTKILYSLGTQAINGEILGMALILPAGSVNRTWEAPAEGSGIVSTHLVAFKPEHNSPATYCFFAVWEKQEPQVKDKDFFVHLLKKAANQTERATN